MLVPLQIVTLILVAIAMALSLAHALELPGKMRLPREHYLAVQTIYYPGFTFAGIAEPLAVAALASLLFLLPPGTPAFWLTAASLAGAALAHLLYWTLTAPVNRVWLRHERLSAAAQSFFGAAGQAEATEPWTVLRDRWERSHLWRAAASGAAFVLTAAATAI